MALAAVTVLVIVLVTHDSPAAGNSVTPAPRPRGRTTDTASPTSPGLAPMADYTYLLIQASDLDTAATTTGPPIQNPGNVPGASVGFANADRTRTLDDLVVVFADPATAARAAKDRAAVYGDYVTGAPQPFEVGTNGLIGVGLSPDKSKSVTYATFAEGRAIVDLEFHSALDDPAPRDAVVDAAQKQDAAIKSRLPG
nr:hypothetical protein [Mycobacterium shigaense]MEA1125031.1 hypothetical protein [Mycobacterium shigaense]